MMTGNELLRRRRQMQRRTRMVLAQRRLTAVGPAGGPTGSAPIGEPPVEDLGPSEDLPDLHALAA